MTPDTLNNQTRESAEAGELDSYRTLIKRLPITVRPALNGQLASWDTLFPFERQRFSEFMRGVAGFDPAAFDALTSPLRRLEDRMGVESWNFSQNADTMENASLLARSADYLEWRNQVQRFYSAVEQAAHASAPSQAPQSRVIVAVLPGSLPFERATVWKQWGNLGTEISIDGDPARIAGLLLKGKSSHRNVPVQQGDLAASELWLIDAGSGFSADRGVGSSLNVAALGPLRDRVLAQVNTVPKSIEATDQTLAAIRTRNWDPWWPPELKDDAPLRKFIMDVYLSGNGALIFSNAFVEWAASEAIRRARPRLLFTRFGLRAKPKPFTGIAIFENQQRISTLPDVDDPQGSAIDAVVLARYILLAAQRYPESAQTAFLCVAESAQSAYLVLPEPLKASWPNQRKATPEQIAQYLTDHLSTPSSDHIWNSK
jgi:hypothetical protein